MPDAGYKRCTMCGETRPGSQFSPDARKKDGLQARCKPCGAAISRRWREANPEAQREQGRRKYAVIREERPESHRDRVQRWREQNREKANALARANLAVLRAIRHGELTRPDTCSACGARTYIEAHHPDHAKVLEVEWLCRICHRAADKERRNG